MTTSADDEPSIRAVLNFSEKIAKLRNDYRSIEVRLLAAKRPKGSHILLAGEAILRATDPEPRSIAELESAAVLAQHYWLPISDLGRLEGCLSHRVVLGANPAVKIRTGTAGNEQSLAPPDISFQQLHQRYNDHSTMLDRRVSLVWMGASPNQVLGARGAESLERDLPPGFSRLSEVVGAVIPGGETTVDRAVCFELAAPILIRVEFTRRGGYAEAEIRVAQTVDREQLFFTLRELDQWPYHPRLCGQPIPVDMKSLTWRKYPGEVRTKVSHSLSPEFGAELQVRYMGSEWWNEPMKDPAAAEAAISATKRSFTARPSSDHFSSSVLGGLSMTTQAGNKNPQEVFLVHGRNKDAVEQMCVFLTSLGLKIIEWPQAVLLTRKPSPYIGDVLDAAMARAQAIVVLLTGDDEAVLRDGLREQNDGPTETEPQAQPRMNVIFEAGLAQGRYHDQTLLIQLGKVKLLSDIFGQHIPRVTGDVEWRKDVLERLKQAGCAVDDTGARWMKAGDFSKVIEHVPTKAEVVAWPAPAKASHLRASARPGYGAWLEDIIHPHAKEAAQSVMVPLAITNESQEAPNSLTSVSLSGDLLFPASNGLLAPVALVMRQALYVRDAKSTELLEFPIRIAPMDTLRCRVYFSFPRDAWEGLPGGGPGQKELRLNIGLTDLSGLSRSSEVTVKEALPG
ncbi:MAG: nucleotide-binding protein [Planctomycetes bacterium]|nr:nucleotide-binding protein [Planctomycetota bacterium]